jgi:hypothetical protein
MVCIASGDRVGSPSTPHTLSMYCFTGVPPRQGILPLADLGRLSTGPFTLYTQPISRDRQTWA